MQNKKDMTIKDLARECRTVEDIQEVLKELFKDTLQEIFEAEMDEHLGYEKHNFKEINTGNSRNGYSEKTIQTRFGNTKIDVPRDRNGIFEPQIVKKYEKTSNQLEEQIIAMLRVCLLETLKII
jgi:putative transposase